MNSKEIDEIFNIYFAKNEELTYHDKIFFLKLLVNEKKVFSEAKFRSDIYFSFINNNSSKIEEEEFSMLDLSDEEKNILIEYNNLAKNATNSEELQTEQKKENRVAYFNLRSINKKNLAIYLAGAACLIICLNVISIQSNKISTLNNKFHILESRDTLNSLHKNVIDTVFKTDTIMNNELLAYFEPNPSFEKYYDVQPQGTRGLDDISVIEPNGLMSYKLNQDITFKWNWRIEIAKSQKKVELSIFHQNGKLILTTQVSGEEFILHKTYISNIGLYYFKIKYKDQIRNRKFYVYN